MTEKWPTAHLKTPLYVAVGITWLGVILWVLIGNVIIRETAVGKVAREMDRLPQSVAKPAFVLCWCLFFLGWTVPMFFGIKRLFRRTEGDVSR
jgi:hypothetical protein